MGLFDKLRDVINNIEDTILRISQSSIEDWPREVFGDSPIKAARLSSDFCDAIQEYLEMYSPVGEEPIGEESPYYVVRDSTRTGRPSTIKEGWDVTTDNALGIWIDHQDPDRVDWLRFGRNAYDIPARGVTPNNQPTMFFWYGSPKRWGPDPGSWQRPWIVKDHAIERHVADGYVSPEIESEFDSAGEGDFVLVALSEAERDFGDDFQRLVIHIGESFIETATEWFNDIDDEEIHYDL